MGIVLYRFGYRRVVIVRFVNKGILSVVIGLVYLVGMCVLRSWRVVLGVGRVIRRRSRAGRRGVGIGVLLL